MKKIRFNDSPPPHVGWWLCNCVNGMGWRWHNGDCWSIPVNSNCTNRSAGILSYYSKALPHELILWCDYWPENARVPRVIPNCKG